MNINQDNDADSKKTKGGEARERDIKEGEATEKAENIRKLEKVLDPDSEKLKINKKFVNKLEKKEVIVVKAGTNKQDIKILAKIWEDAEFETKINENINSLSNIKKEDEGLLLKTSTSDHTEEEGEQKEGYLNFITDKDLPICFNEKRHTDKIQGLKRRFKTWRLEGEAQTVCIALALCLKFDNINPTDKIINNAYAKLECWKDPNLVPPKQAIVEIGSRLQKQYERLQFKFERRVRCHQCLDPTVHKLKEMCVSLSKRSKNERIVFHYNGHGGINPSELGEIFVHNKDFTQYMPLLIWDLITWMQPPIAFVFDCVYAERILINLEQYMKFQQELFEVDLNKGITILAASSAAESLPLRPDLPADVFTSSLTTPIKMALHWHVVVNRNRLVQHVDPKILEKIPGRLNDRRTMLGELYWIFTAITDTIAWSTFPQDLFNRLYRKDEIVASLFRNYLLAERIMKADNCNTVTYPRLRPTYKHHLWDTWDYILDEFLTQLRYVVNYNQPYEQSAFFTDQLIAFERWLLFASEKSGQPEQLPILLQVLLNKTYRNRALELLVKFVDLGPWAVNLALSVGIFPYMLQLLNRKTEDLQEPLVFIWAKILAVDNSCQIDLFMDNDCKIFITILKNHSIAPIYRTLAASILTTVVNNFAAGKFKAICNSLITVCLEELLWVEDSRLKQWITICLAKVWDKCDKGRWTGVRDNAHEKLYPLLEDPCPEVRAAAVYALGTFIHSVYYDLTEHADKINQSIAITLVDKICHDMNPLVRQELVVALQWIVLTYPYKFITLAAQESNLESNKQHDLPLKRSGSSLLPLNAQSLKLEMDSPRNLKRAASISAIGGSSSSPPSRYIRYSPFNVKTWTALCCLEADAQPKVAKMSAVITNHVRSKINKIAEIRRPISADSGVNSHKENRIIHDSLVSTEFVSWSHKLLTLPLLKVNKPEDDPESEFNKKRDLKMERNSNVRTKAYEEYKRAFNCGTYYQRYTLMYTQTPTLLQFHPYEFQIAVAGENNFLVCNINQKREPNLSLFKKKQLKKTITKKKITALQWVNAHDVALLMLAFDDGTVELWKTGNDPVLVSAWRAYNELTPLNKQIPSDVALIWEQWKQTVVTAGSNRIIRLWDAGRESHISDIPTGSKYPITCIDSIYASMSHKELVEANKEKHGLIAAGFADGIINLYDRRCRPRDAKVMTFLDHTSSILGLSLYRNYIISGSDDGYVRIYDIRSKALTDTYYKPKMENLTAFSIHRNSQIYAWGSSDRYINIFNMFGDPLNEIRSQEGSIFNTRMGAINCLAFHPHRVMLAAGTNDRSILIYTMA